jgi:hypothetical protein
MNSNTSFVFISSYPRSGNTMMRTVLNHCFGLQSGSVYSNDLGGNKRLERYVGHVEPHGYGNFRFPPGSIPLLKTHELPVDSTPAIYVVRDGRAACMSVWRFYHKSIPMAQIIPGPVRVGSWQFGNWSDHLMAWKPWQRPKTLLVKYEDLCDDLPSVVQRVGQFLNRKPIKYKIPPRRDIAAVDGRWVREGRIQPESLSPEHLDLFKQYHGPMMERLGYWSCHASTRGTSERGHIE